MIIIAVQYKNPTYFLLATMILTIVASLFIAVQPFHEKASHLTTINASFVLLLALWHGAVLGASASTTWKPSMVLQYFFIVVIAGILPVLYVSGVILHWMYSQRKFAVSKLQAWKSGYNILP
jgi:uncharacterized membrane protein